jgi:hypothetical protein
MPKHNRNKRNNKMNNNNRKSRSRRGKGSADTMTAESHVLKSVPRPVRTNYTFRRTWNQIIPYTMSAGWNAAAYDLEFNFALSVSNINIGGVGTYSPSTPSYSEIVNLFDNYRIECVTLRIDWDFDSYNPAVNATVAAPIIYHIADYNDSVAVALSDVLQYPDVKVHSFMTNGYSPLIIQMKPRPLTDIASTGVLTGYGPALRAPWLSTSYATVPHYGIKLITGNFGLAAAGVTGSASCTCFIDFQTCNPK